MKSMSATVTFVVATVCAGLLPVHVCADPVVVTRGTVAARTWDEMGAYFLAPIELGVLTTTGGLATTFYRPGASASLANHIQVANVELVGAFNGPGSIDFNFTTGQVVQLPGAVPLETIGNPFYAVYTPRFTFTGTALGYNSLGDIVFSRDFTGVGTSRFAFHGVLPMFAEREGFFLDDTIFNFDAADPVPEPATLLMLVTGLGLFTAKRRIGMRPAKD